MTHLRISLLVALGFAVACGGAPPAPAAAPPSTLPPATSSAPAVDLVYGKFTDPYYLAHGDERNVYGRRTIARLWAMAAGHDPAGAARDARLAEANEALTAAERSVAAQNDPCAAHVTAALERAQATKAQLEQQYLQVTQDAGEQSEEAQRLDAQVHLLRDEIEELGALSAPCPKQMFDTPPETT